MDFFQDLTRAVDQATDSAVRSGKSAQTKSRIAKLQRQREQSCASLGATLYPIVREDEKLRAGNEQLIQSIERIDVSIKQLETQLLDLNTKIAPRPMQPGAPRPTQPAPAQSTTPGQQAAPTQQAAPGQSTTPGQPTAPAPQDATPLYRAEAAQNTPRCPHCNAQLLPGAFFCTNCGQRVIS